MRCKSLPQTGHEACVKADGPSKDRSVQSFFTTAFFDFCASPRSFFDLSKDTIMSAKVEQKTQSITNKQETKSSTKLIQGIHRTELGIIQILIQSRSRYREIFILNSWQQSSLLTKRTMEFLFGDRLDLPQTQFTPQGASQETKRKRLFQYGWKRAHQRGKPDPGEGDEPPTLLSQVPFQSKKYLEQ